MRSTQRKRPQLVIYFVSERFILGQLVAVCVEHSCHVWYDGWNRFALLCGRRASGRTSTALKETRSLRKFHILFSWVSLRKSKANDERWMRKLRRRLFIASQLSTNKLWRIIWPSRPCSSDAMQRLSRSMIHIIGIRYNNLRYAKS